MRLEALGRYDEAIYLYDKLLEADETNALFRKRKIATLLAKGERAEAIRALNDYLEVFINDTEAWLQLSELFIADGDYARAAFAFEELLLANVSREALVGISSSFAILNLKDLFLAPESDLLVSDRRDSLHIGRRRECRVGEGLLRAFVKACAHRCRPIRIDSCAFYYLIVQKFAICNFAVNIAEMR